MFYFLKNKGLFISLYFFGWGTLKPISLYKWLKQLHEAQIGEAKYLGTVLFTKTERYTICTKGIYPRKKDDGGIQSNVNS